MTPTIETLKTQALDALNAYRAALAHADYSWSALLPVEEAIHIIEAEDVQSLRAARDMAMARACKVA